MLKAILGSLDPWRSIVGADHYMPGMHQIRCLLRVQNKGQEMPGTVESEKLGRRATQ
jgi:hypothetical protein